jgi:hypothetical protein
MAEGETIWVLSIESAKHRVEAGANRLRRDAGGQARKNAKQTGHGQVRQRMHPGRNKHFGFRAGFGSRESLARDADDLKRPAAHSVLGRDVDRAADRLRIAYEAAHPVIVGENRNRIRAWIAIVILREQTPERRPEPEGAEHPSRHVLNVRFLHLLAGPVSQIRLLGQR